MTCTIRNAVPEDVPIILKFIRELAEYEKLLSEVKATEDLLHQYLFATTPKAYVVMVEKNRVAIGFALYFYNFSTFLSKPGLYIEDLYIQPSYRGKGYGTKLLRFLARYALEKSCGRMEWWVLDWNKPAMKLYNKIGAIPMDEWTVQRLDGKALEIFADARQ